MMREFVADRVIWKLRPEGSEGVDTGSLVEEHSRWGGMGGQGWGLRGKAPDHQGPTGHREGFGLSARGLGVGGLEPLDQRSDVVELPEWTTLAAVLRIDFSEKVKLSRPARKPLQYSRQGIIMAWW